ncbi:hypothetical protein [Bacillus smithii]|uniref:hypothetical protein n=1 Tax=Bacillus smithii TaxID=1479 RepID=UPI002E20C6B2|nr:hypothetical protein [Bacillus smithii]MED1454746.1 hypothetical protein [Bacillus smithii]
MNLELSQGVMKRWLFFILVPFFALILAFASVSETFAATTTFNNTLSAGSYAGSSPCTTSYPNIVHEVNVKNTTGDVYVYLQYLDGGSWKFTTGYGYHLTYWNTPYKITTKTKSSSTKYRVLIKAVNTSNVIVSCYGTN